MKASLILQEKDFATSPDFSVNIQTVMDNEMFDDFLIDDEAFEETIDDVLNESIFSLNFTDLSKDAVLTAAVDQSNLCSDTFESSENLSFSPVAENCCDSNEASLSLVSLDESWDEKKFDERPIMSLEQAVKKLHETMKRTEQSRNMINQCSLFKMGAEPDSDEKSALIRCLIMKENASKIAEAGQKTETTHKDGNFSISFLSESSCLSNMDEKPRKIRVFRSHKTALTKQQIGRSRRANISPYSRTDKHVAKCFDFHLSGIARSEVSKAKFLTSRIALRGMRELSCNSKSNSVSDFIKRSQSKYSDGVRLCVS